MNTITPDQYAFFTQIADLAFVNPFSKKREQADWRILNQNPKAMSLIERRKLLVAKIDLHFHELTRNNPFDIRHYQGKTQDTLRLAWLVKSFYSYQELFTEHIKAQQQAGDKALELDFAIAILDHFEQAGFSRQEATHFIALLFQLQRAFSFIDEAVSGTSEAIIELRKRLWNNIFTFNP